MSLDSYAALKAEIADWLDRSDLSSQIDTFIDLAEEHHRRNLRVRQMISRATASLSTSTRYLALPTNYVHMRILRLMTTPVTPGGTRNELSRTSPAFSPKMARSNFSSGDN